MDKMETKLSDICEMKDVLVKWLKHQIDMGAEAVDADEAGKVVDMIKDLADAEKSIREACYYKTVTAAMEDATEEGSYGYNGRRYSSSGRYAPAGRGHISGYMPMDGYENNRMGYVESKMMDEVSDRRYGKAYNDYKTARKHYTQTNSTEDRKDMEMHADEHLRDSISTIREMWRDAEPAMKKKIKTDLSGLINEMPT